MRCGVRVQECMLYSLSLSGQREGSSILGKTKEKKRVKREMKRKGVILDADHLETERRWKQHIFTNKGKILHASFKPYEGHSIMRKMHFG